MGIFGKKGPSSFKERILPMLGGKRIFKRRILQMVGDIEVTEKALKNLPDRLEDDQRKFVKEMWVFYSGMYSLFADLRIALQEFLRMYSNLESQEEMEDPAVKYVHDSYKAKIEKELGALVRQLNLIYNIVEKKE